MNTARRIVLMGVALCLGSLGRGLAQTPPASVPAVQSPPAQQGPAADQGATAPPGVPVPPPAAVQTSPLAQSQNGRDAADNSQILATGIRSPLLPSNHALIITVSQYLRSPLPGVLTDRKLGLELAQRFGVPPQNITELSEEQVTRGGLKQALASMDQQLMPGDKLFVYFSGHGARYFNKASGQCTESIVMQDMHVVTNAEFAAMIKPLSAKADKTIVMLDSCHSGGVAQAASSRALSGPFGPQRAKFSPEASSPQCSLAVNLGSFSQSRGIDLNTTDNNMVLVAAARKNEVAWDTSKGGALTYNFEQCLNGSAVDQDHSGSISMQELAACVQARLDKSQEESARQHVTLAGNSALVPSFFVAQPSGGAAPAGAPAVAPAGAPAGAPAAGIDTLAALNDIFSQRDDRWHVRASLDRPTLKIGSNLALTIRSDRRGFVYVFYRGTNPDSLYLLFPNALDAANSLEANQDLQLPRRGWAVTALGPRGTDHILVLVTDTARDFSSLALPAEYVSRSGPFAKIQASAQAVARIGQIATLSAAVHQAQCTGGSGKRDLGVALACSSVFGASMLSVEETE